MGNFNYEFDQPGTYCEQRPVTQWKEQVKVIRKQWKSVGREADCLKLLNHQFTPTTHLGLGLEAGPEQGLLGWCSYDEQIKNNVSRNIMEWQCNKTGQSTQTQAQWNSVWSMSIFSQFQYMAKTPWCFTWDGTWIKGVLAILPSVVDKGTTRIEKEHVVPWWKCEKVYDCSNADSIIQRIPPLAAALKFGCYCRGFHNNLTLTSIFTPRRGYFFSCKKSTIQSPGHLVWALSDGTWTTHLPVDGKVKQVTLGMPTLCPIWKKSPFKGPLEDLRLKRTKRSETDDDTWNEPSTGVKIGWALESL